MANYVANYKEKPRILQKREQELLQAINHEFSAEKIRKAAEHVRVAKLNMYKSRLGQIPPVEGQWERREAKWKEKTSEWQAISLDDIVE